MYRTVGRVIWRTLAACRIQYGYTDLENYSYGTCPDLPTIDDLLNLADLFIDFGADVNERLDTGGGAVRLLHTPLSLAAQQGHAEFVELLLARGADVNRDDPPETNARSIAQQLGFRRIADLLE